MAKIYSTDKENWTFSSESMVGAIEEYIADNTGGDFNVGDTLTVFEGDKIPYKFNDLLCVNSIIEDIQGRAYDNVGEHAEGFLDDVTDVQKTELGVIINLWAKKHGIEPNFYSVNNIKEIEVTLTKEMMEG